MIHGRNLSSADEARLVTRLRADHGEDVGGMIAEAWFMAGQVFVNRRRGLRTCRICGCVDAHACDGGCAWVEGAEADLCTACDPETGR